MSTAVLFSTKQKHAIFSLSLALALRMFGVSLFLPVLTIYAHEFTDNGHLIGLALGIYGLVQAVLQVPIGMISDKIGRKRVILAGLGIYIIGSIMAAQTTSIMFLIAARAMQGAGAISGAVYAYIADVIEREKRSRAMAFLGMPFGIAFSVGIILGPALGHAWGIPSLFWFCAGLVAIAAIYVYFAIEERKAAVGGEAEIKIKDSFKVLRNRNLLRINYGGFIANFFQTATFLFLPVLTKRYVDLNQFWKIMVPMVVVGTAIMFWSARNADAGRSKLMTQLAFLLLGASAIVFMFSGFLFLVIGAILFFAGFSITQPLLSTAVTIAADERMMGTTSGLYNMSQFIGTFLGGALGGFFLDNIPVFLTILSFMGLSGSVLVSGAVKNKSQRLNQI